MKLSSAITGKFLALTKLAWLVLDVVVVLVAENTAVDVIHMSVFAC